MRRTWQTMAIVTLLVGSNVAMGEGPILRFWRDVGRSTARNNAWPDPFIPDDRAAARAPFEVMTQNGWRYNNTLSDHHFDLAGRLNESGDRMVQTISQQYPTGRRMIYVLRSTDPAISQARLDSVYAAANRYVLPGDVAQVGETHLRPEGWPASFVVTIERGYQESTPQPRIPPRAGAAAGGTTSSSGAAGS